MEAVPSLTGLCAGFEAGDWRAAALARHLFEWLPEFALTQSELESFRPHNAVPYLARAARAVYESDRYQRRGEFGELLLHAIIRENFATEPAISKMFFKDAANDTVKGFDAVHVVCAQEGELELWLGEAKLYGDAADALAAAADDLRRHTDGAWLRGEFLAIENKIDPRWSHGKALKALIHRNRSLDDVFAAIRIPVLVTYDSRTVAASTGWDENYLTAIAADLRALRARLAEKELPGVTIHLLLVPLGSKAKLVEQLDQRLRVLLEL
jgi:hypothetical protein